MTVMVTLSNVIYVQTFIGNLFSIPTAMSNGAWIRFVNNKIEVRKKDDVFKFLPANADNCGSLFSISAKRRIVNTETAFMAKKQTRCNGDTTSQDKSKKVMFDEDVSTYIYDEENKKEKDKTNKNQKEKETET